MSIRKVATLWGIVLVVAVLFWGDPCPAQTPDLSLPNFTNSPLLRKFVDSLPGLGAAGANNLGQYIPVAIPDTATYPGSDYYEIELGEYTQQMHSDLPATKFRGYRQTNMGGSGFHYLGPLIIAQRNRPVRIKFTNNLPTGTHGNLFIPVDTTANGAGVIPQGITAFTITNGGSGYSCPTVAITGGGGSGARATATINNAGAGTISSIAVTSGGVGYSVPTVTFTGGAPIVPASATVTVTAGAISNINLTYGGIGYTSAPLVTITGGGGTGATAHATISAGGVVDTLNIDNPGTNYSVPTVTIAGGGASVNATATATITSGAITLITVVTPGAGYSAPTVAISNGGGAGATAIATVTAGAVTGITLTAPGTGYTSDPDVAIEPPPGFPGPGLLTATATATVHTGGGYFSQNRATLHMHGGFTPWVSDGTPHQWTTPAGEPTSFTRGASVADVPDMGPSAPIAVKLRLKKWSKKAILLV